MTNSYRELKNVALQHSLSVEDLIHALMATVYTNCCERCSDTFHSSSFAEAFDRMIRELEFCKALSERSLAVAGD